MSFSTKVLCWICFSMAAIGGGYLGSLIATKRYPLSVIERHNLTPTVRSGDALLLAQHVDRKDQCDITLRRTITTATGQRFAVTQVFDEGFGPLGGDKYILPVPTDSAAAHGPAKMYSKAYAYCSILDWIKPTESEPWTMSFQFADETTFETPPESFRAIGVKP